MGPTRRGGGKERAARENGGRDDIGGLLTEKGIWQRRSNDAWWLRWMTDEADSSYVCSGDGGSSWTCQIGTRG
jgi:hypothetical protein